MLLARLGGALVDDNETPERPRRRLLGVEEFERDPVQDHGAAGDRGVAVEQAGAALGAVGGEGNGPVRVALAARFLPAYRRDAVVGERPAVAEERDGAAHRVVRLKEPPQVARQNGGVGPDE